MNGHESIARYASPIFSGNTLSFFGNQANPFMTTYLPELSQEKEPTLPKCVETSFGIFSTCQLLYSLSVHQLLSVFLDLDTSFALFGNR